VQEVKVEVEVVVVEEEVGMAKEDWHGAH